MNHQDDFIGIPQAADLLGVSIDTVRRWIKSGKLKAEKVKNRYRISRQEIQRALSEVSRQKPMHDFRDELIASLRERIRELEADKAYLQQRILALEEIVKLLTAGALPKPSLAERIKGFFGRGKGEGEG